jgi:hypothetical protein
MVARTIRALLVGIDEYEPPVPALHGCVNDIEAFARLLRKRAAAAGDHLDIRILRNAAASRAAVISAFDEHLGTATAGQTALFYYSGHGSQEPALPEHMELEPDGLNETLVLHDSRGPGGYDLADKELAQLVAGSCASGAHVAVILDCCHSGSGVRAVLEDGVAVRRAPADVRRRPAESYLGLPAVAPAPTRSAANWLNAETRYVLLAACRSDQSAKEVRVGEERRGAMSAALEVAVSRSIGDVSYQALQAWVAAGVRNLAADQTPVLESPEPEDIQLPFLGGAAAPSGPMLTASRIPEHGWVLDAGLLHGIPTPVPGQEPTAVTMHPLAAEELPASADALAKATVDSVGVTTSTLSVTTGAEELDPAATYRAVIRRLPVTPLPVLLDGDPELIARLREDLADSPLTRTVSSGEAALRVLAASDGISLTRPGAERALVAVEPPSPGGIDRIVSAVQHVARWRMVYDRSNPDAALPGSAMDLACLDENGAELDANGGRIERWYRQGRDRQAQPTMKVRLRNRSSRRLYYALLALSELYGISSLLPGGGVWLDPGQEAFVPGSDGKPILYLDVPPDQERTTDVLKLIVSTEEFDAQQLQQDDLRPPTRRRGAQAAAKDISTSPELPAEAADWSTAEISVTTVRPAGFRDLSGAAPVPLAPDVVMLGHPRLTARVRLTSLPMADRDATVSLLPPLLVDQPGITEPYSFAATRVPGAELSVLELADVGDASAVSVEQPLIIKVDGIAEPGERVLPIAFDGMDYLPAGYSRTAGGQTEIRITRLPSPSEELTRSLGGSLKILFRKLVLRPLGLGYDHPHLSVVTFGADGEAAYDHDGGHVRAAIAGARRLLLVVHGIIGDTRGMAAAMAVTAMLGDYDALLAFDYENVDTPVQETARALGERLRSAGLAPDGGQQVDILAHSMGGLVSRWFIEREEGAGMVRHLVVCGTPSGGSPWPGVRDLATSMLTLALNGMSAPAGPLGVAGTVLGFAVQAVERPDVTLDSMVPGSGLLTALAASPQPPVPYTAVAGRDPFGPAGDASRARRILEKLRIPKLVLDAVFADTASDLAVSVRSATTFGASWTPPPRIEADCGHLTYFASAGGIAAVQRALSWHDS